MASPEAEEEAGGRWRRRPEDNVPKGTVLVGTLCFNKKIKHKNVPKRTIPFGTKEGIICQNQ